MSVDVAAEAGALLRRSGRASEVIRSVDCPAGGNNRVVRLDTERGPFVAKLYFTDAQDGRDRLRSEYAFLQYAVGRGLRCVPVPIAADPERRLALYEYVDGAPLAASMLTDAHVAEAVAFFARLNARSPGDGDALPTASDACFSIRQHFELVERRLHRLRALRPEDDLEVEAATLVEDVARAWDEVQPAAAATAARLRMDLDAPLAIEDRCVSPSDFGFHNALLRPSGEVAFLDFEYAGWDDPAKALTDFFCQPQVPVSRRLFTAAAEGFTAHAPSRHTLVDRARLLLPVCWLKWCLIRLNEFTPEALRRRVFAGPGRDVAALKRERLERARQALRELPALRESVDAGAAGA